MPLCPNQHESRATDFCDVCGVEMTDDAPPGGKQTCLACHAEHEAGAGDFCEVCGYHLKAGALPVAAPVPAAPTPLPPAWELIVTVAANPHVGMPDDTPPPTLAARAHPLAADTVLIGRRSVRRQIDPEISLDHDDGVSHRHACLTRLPTGGYALEDCGSSNGTTVGGVELKPGAAVALQAGDRITLGRWTCLTLRRQEPSPP